jgi:hypothetical protein
MYDEPGFFVQVKAGAIIIKAGFSFVVNILYFLFK